MLESLRARLLLWYTAILAVVIVVFGATVGYLTWRSRIAGVDALLLARARALAAALEPTHAGTFDLTLPLDPPGTLTGAPALYHVLWDGAGRLIDRSDPDLEMPAPREPGARMHDGRREITIRAASGPTVLVGRNLTDLRAERWSLLSTLAAVGVVAMTLSLVGGWWLIGGALAPIARISATARTMTGGDLSARIPIDRVETELGLLARALNEAFDRMHESLERQRRFTADASHELRTPLTTLSTEVQWALGRERSGEEYRQALQTTLRAGRRMQAVVERLLALARAEAGADDGPVTAVRLDEIVRRAAADLRPLAGAKRLAVAVETSPVTVTGNAERLLEAVTNVLSNAIQYNVEDGRVQVHAGAIEGTAVLTIADTGVGISAADLPRVFDPFFRADPARSRDAGGAGLGLAVTRAIVERHGGTVTCESQPEGGATVIIELPRQASETSP